MAKILLVEDDTNLQDIYAARLTAEGHEVTAASDGETALANAVKVRPDLVILDVMMPKISGFDVLDILRTTPETKDAKVIMMTALSQEEDKQRGIKMGANRYLVKSQVTLEDVITAVGEELGEGSVSVSNETDVQQVSSSVATADTPASSTQVASTVPSPNPADTQSGSTDASPTQAAADTQTAPGTTQAPQTQPASAIPATPTSDPALSSDQPGGSATLPPDSPAPPSGDTTTATSADEIQTPEKPPTKAESLESEINELVGTSETNPEPLDSSQPIVPGLVKSASSTTATSTPDSAQAASSNPASSAVPEIPLSSTEAQGETTTPLQAPLDSNVSGPQLAEPASAPEDTEAIDPNQISL